MDNSHSMHGMMSGNGSSQNMAGPDMSGMDRDMSGMDHSMPGMHHMMFFNVKLNGTYVLFQEIQLEEKWHLAVACVVLAIVAALYEGLKVFREYLLQTYGNSQGSTLKIDNRDVVIATGSVRSRIFSCMHFLQTFLHMIQVTVSYMLMLVVMTYNVWLCLSVVLGAGLGYFIFGWKRAVIIDTNEHCH